MQNNYFLSHIKRLESALLGKGAINNIPDWITSNTRLRGRAFSFDSHEYQKTVLSDPANVKIIKKCSQVGISELSVRRLLAFVSLYPGVTSLYVLPTALFAQLFAKTRVDTVIESSTELANSVWPGTDSSTVKRFLNDSFIYFRGASRSGQAISVPVDDITYDEIDFAEDQAILSTFTSRLTHSDYKTETFLSTPTLPGYGISEKFDQSLQFEEIWVCSHCNHEFLPDYFNDIVLPGWDRPLEEFRKADLDKISVAGAYLKCPKCGKEPDHSIEHRRWVTVNPDTKYEAHGYHITPFCAPDFITPGNLITSSTKYRRKADFVNFELGNEMEDSETTLSHEELLQCFTTAEAPSGFVTVMGIDLGGLCATHIAQIDPYGGMFVIHSECIPLADLDRRRKELAAKYKVVSTVIDAMPYTDLVMRIQGQDPNCWAAAATNSKGLELYRLREIEEDSDKALSGLRVVNFRRDLGLDTVVSAIRNGDIMFKDSEERDVIIDHLTDMKRIKTYDKAGEMSFKWVKSAQGVDHYMFALLFTFLASKIRTLSTIQTSFPHVAGKFSTKKSSTF